MGMFIDILSRVYIPRQHVIVSFLEFWEHIELFSLSRDVKNWPQPAAPDCELVVSEVPAFS